MCGYHTQHLPGRTVRRVDQSHHVANHGLNRINDHGKGIYWFDRVHWLCLHWFHWFHWFHRHYDRYYATEDLNQQSFRSYDHWGQHRHHPDDVRWQHGHDFTDRYPDGPRREQCGHQPHDSPHLPR